MTVTDPAAPAPRVKQPPGLYLLFNVEMWERFSFYGMRAFLILFLVSSAGGFGWTKEKAAHWYAWYTGLCYMTPLLGGFLADQVLGTHRAILVGSVLIASGHFCLAFPSATTFVVGLGLIILGTGFHKPNISTMVGQLYQPGDRRRDAGFTIYYMGVNTGAFLGQIICGYLAKSPRFGWHWGFASAGVGMTIGTIVYVIRRRRFLGTIGDPPAKRARPDAGAAVALGAAAVKAPLSRADKQGMAAIGILAVFNIFFWSAFEQAGSSMNFFAEERTRRVFFGWEMPAPWFQSVNALAIMVFAPLFASLWTKLGARGREPSTPRKFALALVLVALGFVVLVVGARGSEGGVRVSALFLVVAYVLHTWGELCLSPVGLSMVTKLAPARLSALLMGAWWFSFFLSDLTGGLIASQIEKIKNVFHLLGGQADFFLIFVFMPLAAAAILWLLSGTIEKLMAKERAGS